MLYLQWINVTRIKRPLIMGFIYLMVFYLCMTILLAVANPGPSTEWIAAALIPGGIIGLGLKSWTSYAGTWMLALLFQFVFCGIFVFLQQRKLQELASPGPRRRSCRLAAFLRVLLEFVLLFYV